ncbi:MAG: RluA family pseudouridine synthase [Chitinophagales bacterium]|nr:RluA family pseudouridine synthase [Chitinophagales bacterium]
MSKENKQSDAHIVDGAIINESLIDYAVNAFPVLGSRSAVKKAIATERLKKNGHVARFGDRVKGGDRLELEHRNRPKPKTFKLDIETVYEDDYLIIVNKPGGIAVNGNRYKTVENALAGTVRTKAEDALPQPVATHRLDVPTKGLVILAKTKTALINMNKDFQEKKVQKTYVAVVHGQLAEKGTIEEPIKGKRAITEFEPLKVVPSRNFGHFSLVKLYPVTGRTHQLRIHMSNRGHLVVGDKMYAKRQTTILGKGMYLCAVSLRFQHPISGEEVYVEIPTPPRFLRLVDREENRFGE